MYQRLKGLSGCQSRMRITYIIASNNLRPGTSSLLIHTLRISRFASVRVRLRRATIYAKEVIQIEFLYSKHLSICTKVFYDKEIRSTHGVVISDSRQLCFHDRLFTSSYSVEQTDGGLFLCL